MFEWVYINKDYYGKIEYKDKKTKEVPLGNAIHLKSIYRNIETNEYAYNLGWNYLGSEINEIIPRSAITETGLLGYVGKGMDVTKRTCGIAVDVIRKQEANFKNPIILLHNTLGWSGTPNSKEPLYYKASKVVGDIQSHYTGSFHVATGGKFSVWKDFVKREIIGHFGLETALLIGLSAILVPLINPYVHCDSPIFSIIGNSSIGKGTAAFLAVSVSGKPSIGNIEMKLPTGEKKEVRSLFQSWNASKSALEGLLSGNNGCILVLDEIGEALGNLDAVIYSVANGTGKSRSTVTGELQSAHSHCTTILATGEVSLRDKMKKQTAGSIVRIFEITGGLTADDGHSNRIKTMASKHYGHAGPMFAAHLLSKVQNEGIDSVLEVVNQCVSDYLQDTNLTSFSKRRAYRTGGLLLATAKLAGEALGIPFSYDSIKAYLHSQEPDNAVHTDGDRAYEWVKQWFVKNSRHFSKDNGELEVNCDFYGTMCSTKCEESLERPGQYTMGEYVVLEEVLLKALKKEGNFENPKRIMKDFKACHYISCDKDRLTKVRQIGGLKDALTYVFPIYISEAEAQKHLHNQPTQTKKKARKYKRQDITASIFENRLDI